MADFYELSGEQRRQLIDAQQVFAAWRPAAFELDQMGGLYWNTSKGGRRYLYQKRHGRRRSLGRESPALARRKDEQAKRSKELRPFLRPLSRRIEEMAPVNRAIGIGRIPTIAAKIVRELDMEGLLGSHIIVAGTNAIYSYEAAAGVIIAGQHVATGDADLLWDTKQSLLLTATGVRRDGLMSVFRRVDPSFTTAYGFNPTNSRGYVIDLIIPESDDFPQMRPNADVEAQPISGVEWLISSPQFEQVIVGHDGIPLRIVVPEPRTFALHKLWVSRREDRNPVKKIKDVAHARIVAELAQTHLGLRLAGKEMPWLPPTLRKLMPELKTLIRDRKKVD